MMANQLKLHLEKTEVLQVISARGTVMALQLALNRNVLPLKDQMSNLGVPFGPTLHLVMAVT